MCNSTSSRHTKVAFKTRLSSRVNSAKADVPCDICKLIVQELDIRLANNNTEAEAKEEIEKFCSLLGSFESEVCVCVCVCVCVNYTYVHV